jgi:hypothetical protein
MLYVLESFRTPLSCVLGDFVFRDFETHSIGIDMCYTSEEHVYQSDLAVSSRLQSFGILKKVEKTSILETFSDLWGFLDILE